MSSKGGSGRRGLEERVEHEKPKGKRLRAEGNYHKISRDLEKRKKEVELVNSSTRGSTRRGIAWNSCSFERGSAWIVNFTFTRWYLVLRVSRDVQVVEIRIGGGVSLGPLTRYGPRDASSTTTRSPYVGHRGEPRFARAIFRNEKESHGSRA